MVDELNDYRITCSVIKTELLNRYPFAKPIPNTNSAINHTLWMIEQISVMTDQREIDRHVGWILAKAHSLRLIDENSNDGQEAKALIHSDLAKAF